MSKAAPASLYRGLGRVAVVVGAGVTVGLGLTLGPLGIFSGSLFTLAAFYGAWRSGRTLEAVIEEKVVHLPKQSLSLPRGRGQLIVQGVDTVLKDGGRLPGWELRHDTAGVIAKACRDPLAVRAAAEALAVAGDWPVLWRSSAEDVERRAPGELDVPLAVREALVPAIPRNFHRPYAALYDVVPLPEKPEGVRISYRGGWFGRISAEDAPYGAWFLILALLLSDLLAWWAGPLFVAPALLFSPLLTPDVEVTSAGVRLRRRVFGLTLSSTRLPASEIESLYVDTAPGKRVVAVGDRFHTTLARVSDRYEAAWLRGVVLKALLGERGGPDEELAAVTAARVASGAIAPDEEGATYCPSCLHLGLERIGGALEEEVCPACGGRFLPQAGVERLVEDELGITRHTLRELARYFGGERRTCPSCHSRTSAVRLKGVTADLCQGCGGLWLDPGELGALSGGRYEG